MKSVVTLVIEAGDGEPCPFCKYNNKPDQGYKNDVGIDVQYAWLNSSLGALHMCEQCAYMLATASAIEAARYNCCEAPGKFDTTVALILKEGVTNKDLPSQFIEHMIGHAKLLHPSYHYMGGLDEDATKRGGLLQDGTPDPQIGDFSKWINDYYDAWPFRVQYEGK